MRVWVSLLSIVQMISHYNQIFIQLHTKMNFAFQIMRSVIKKYRSQFICIKLYIILIQPMQTQAQELLKQKLKAKKYKEIDIRDSATVSNLISVFQQLQLNPLNLKLIKNILLNYGFPAIIFLQPFYQGLTQQMQQEYQLELKILASIAAEMSNDCSISEIDYIYKWGLPDVKWKSQQKSQQQMQFICKVVQLSDMKKKYEQQLISTAEIENYVQAIKEQYDSIPFFLQSFKKYYQKNLHQPTLVGSYNIDNSISFYPDETYYFENPNQTGSTPTGGYMFVEDQSTFDNMESSEKMKYYQNTGDSNPLSIETSSERQQPIVFGSNIKQTFKTDFICCRTFFYEKQELKQGENESMAFLNCRYPFKQLQIVRIKEVICSFLNADGGNLFIGVQKLENGKRIVQGGFYSESDKENVLKSFRQITQTIQPDIITQKMYKVDFVPLKEQQDNQFIPGQYLIKVNVRYGIRDDIYSYRENGRDYFSFRSQNEIIHKQGRILLKVLKERIKNPMPIPMPLHPGQCKSPELGQQIHHITNFDSCSRQQKDRIPVAFKQKPAWPEPVQKTRDLSPILMKKTKTLTVPANIGPQQQQPPNMSSIVNKYSQKMLPDDIYSQQSLITKKLQAESKEGYFFVIGINEKQLSPVLQKKGILHEVKIESNRQSRLVVKAFSEQVIVKLRKIFKKIQEKYAAIKIRIYQITLFLEVSSLKKAQEILNQNKCRAEFRRNKICLPNYRQSLQAFLLLQECMQVNFVKDS